MTSTIDADTSAPTNEATPSSAEAPPIPAFPETVLRVRRLLGVRNHTQSLLSDAVAWANDISLQAVSDREAVQRKVDESPSLRRPKFKAFFDAEHDLHYGPATEWLAVCGQTPYSQVGLPMRSFPEWSLVRWRFNDSDESPIPEVVHMRSDRGLRVTGTVNPELIGFVHRWHVVAAQVDVPVFDVSGKGACVEDCDDAADLCDCGADDCFTECSHLRSAAQRLPETMRQMVEDYVPGCSCDRCDFILTQDRDVMVNGIARNLLGLFAPPDGGLPEEFITGVLRWLRLHIALDPAKDADIAHHDEVSAETYEALLAKDISSMSPEELRAHTAEVSKQALNLMKAFQHDIVVATGKALNDAAIRRGWCGEYEREMSIINSGMTGPFRLPKLVRPTRYRVTVSVPVQGMVTFTFDTERLSEEPSEKDVIRILKSTHFSHIADDGTVPVGELGTFLKGYGRWGGVSEILGAENGTVKPSFAIVSRNDS